MEIRSYRRVFDLERRIYRVDQLRLNPGGMPIRGIVYFLAIVATSVLVGRLPLLSSLAAAVPWYVRDLLVPAALATVLGAIRVEGRPFHLAARAIVRHRLSPRTLAGVCARETPPVRWWPRDLLLLPDGSDAAVRALRYTGPGAVLIAVAHGVVADARASGRRGRSYPDPVLAIEASPTAVRLERARVILVERGARVELGRVPSGEG